MSSLIRYTSKADLTKLDLDEIELKLAKCLNGRVTQAYVFGSFAARQVTNTSDIDLILIKETELPFLKRTEEFFDLYDIHANIDILVYTPLEFAKQTSEKVGFWKSVCESMRPLRQT